VLKAAVHGLIQHSFVRQCAYGVNRWVKSPMLLNEAQKQQRINDAEAAKMRNLERLVIKMDADLHKLQARDELVAQR